MGIFDVFKTKMGQAGEKLGDVAEQAKDKASDLMGKKDETPEPLVADDPMAEAVPAEAADMVSEGAPVADAERPSGSSGGMTQTIKDNVASGVEKAGETAKGPTGNKDDDKIDTGVQKAKDRLR